MNRGLGRRRTRRGFTMMETMTSAAVLTLIVFAAVGASQAAMKCTGEVVSSDAESGRVQGPLDRLRALMLSASLGTLSGKPVSGYAQVVEPMLDDVIYGDLEFRTVTGYAEGAPVYVPTPDLAPYRLHLSNEREQAGSLVLETSSSTTTLLEGVRSLTFRRSGKEVRIAIETDAAHGGSFELGVVLLVP